MSGDLTHLLSSSSRLPTDVTFNLQSVTFPAHKAILANALPAFDALFFGNDADPLLYEVDVEYVGPQSFSVFIHHVYGQTVKVDTYSFPTLVELHWLAVNYQDERFITQLVSRMEEMVERQTDYETLTWWEDMVITYKVDKLQLILANKRNAVKMEDDNFETTMEVSGDKYTGFKNPDFTMTDLVRRIYIHGVNKKMGKCELFVEFEKFGDVTDVYYTGKGFAFVTYAMKDMATMAVRKMNGATMNGQTITVNFAKPRNSERGRRDMFYGRSYGVSGVGWAGDGSLDTGGESERRRGNGSHGAGSIDRENWRCDEDSYSNVVNICHSKDDTDKDDLSWRVSSGIDDISDVDSEAEECPIILKSAESLVKGRVEQLKVISASSPGHVVGRPLVSEDQYYRMIEDLTAYCEVTSPTARIKVGMGVGVKIDKLGWTRARIMLMMEHQVELYLCDYGYNVTLTSESLHLLLPRHAVLPHLAHAFHVCGVVAAGGEGGWTRSAKIMTGDLLERGDVEVTVVDHTPVIDANLPFLPSYPADIYIIEKVIMGPMDPITTTRTNLTHTLRMAGLALPHTIFDIPFICKHLKENGSRDVKNIKEIWREEDEHDDKENIEDRDEIVAISDLKLQEKKLVAVNEGDNLADMEIVEERGLRGEYRW